MADFDVVVIGGGPGGYSAALRSAELGASVALIEAEKPGGACVHHACIPTSLLIEPAIRHLEARELNVMGVFEAGEQFNFGRAVARKDALVGQLAEGIRTALRMARVRLIEGRASFQSHRVVSVQGAQEVTALDAEAIIIATGSRWEAPAIPGWPADRVATADVVQCLPQLPRSAVVLIDGPGDVPFGIEYAELLAIAGTEVSVVTAGPRLVPHLDADVEPAVRVGLTDLGIRVFESARAVEGSTAGVVIHRADGATTVAAELILAADNRRPFTTGLGLGAAGIPEEGSVSVGRDCATRVPGVFAAGDVTGGAMLSSAASHMGEVAAENATGGSAITRLAAIPRLLHGPQGIAWVGTTEDSARAAGRTVRCGGYDLSFNARAVTLGARSGLVKVIADAESGELLGVHAVGPEAAEVIAVAAGLMQAEVTVHELAAMVAWHPGVTEGLVQAARRACRD